MSRLGAGGGNAADRQLAGPARTRQPSWPRRPHRPEEQPGLPARGPRRRERKCPAAAWSSARPPPPARETRSREAANMAGRPGGSASPSPERDRAAPNVVARVSQWADDHLRLVQVAQARQAGRWRGVRPGRPPGGRGRRGEGRGERGARTARDRTPPGVAVQPGAQLSVERSGGRAGPRRRPRPRFEAAGVRARRDSRATTIRLSPGGACGPLSRGRWC